MRPRLVKVPLFEVETPEDGKTVITNSWWITVDGCVLGFKVYGKTSRQPLMPQCNKDKEVAERIQKVVYPDSTLIHIPVAYW